MDQLYFYVIICRELVEHNQLNQREAVNIVVNMVSFKSLGFTADDLRNALLLENSNQVNAAPR